MNGKVSKDIGDVVGRARLQVVESRCPYVRVQTAYEESVFKEWGGEPGMIAYTGVNCTVKGESCWLEDKGDLTYTSCNTYREKKFDERICF